MMKEWIFLLETDSRDGMMRNNVCWSRRLCERCMWFLSNLLVKIAKAVPVLLVCWFLGLDLRRVRFRGELETLELWSLMANWFSSGLLAVTMQIRLFISNNSSTFANQILEVLFTQATSFAQASTNIEAALLAIAGWLALAVAGWLALAGLVSTLSAKLWLVTKAGLLGELRLVAEALLFSVLRLVSKTSQVAELTLDVLSSLIVIATEAWSSDMRSSLWQSWPCWLIMLSSWSS